MNNIINQHPCFHKAAARWFGRIHLPVAPDCNIRCRYCTRIYDCANENRPGVTSKLLTPGEAIRWVKQVVEKDRRILVTGIAGPGDPLANRAAVKTLELVHRSFPHLIKCISTNGLLLAEELPRLQAAGVRAVTVTVNAVSPHAGKEIYKFISYRDRIYRGEEGAELLWRKQKEGILAAVRMGMVVKINSVLIPGVNDSHLYNVALAVKEAGAHVMNVIPLIPQGDFAGLQEPSPEAVHLLRRGLAPVIRQIEHCRRCRADAAGML